MNTLEAVPNFSEGRDPDAVARIASAMEGVPGAQLLHVDPEADTHRSVMTLLGKAEAVEEALFRGVAAAIESIDMTHHTGSHPRMGAADVVPLVPWAGTRMDDCIQSAHRLGHRLGEELDLPGWFYGAAALSPEAVYLHDLRWGEFEGLSKKLLSKAVDFGPQSMHPTAGATAVGARGLLVALNCTISTDDVALARKMAGSLREFQKVRRARDGSVVQRVSEGLPGLRALGWYSKRDGLAQVTMNLTNTDEAPPHRVFQRLSQMCSAEGIEIRGSELVGMIPEVLLRAAGQDMEPSSTDPVSAGIRALRLGVLHDFDPEERIIEWVLRRVDASG